MSNCCNDTTNPCIDRTCLEGCPREFDMRCVEYTGNPLENLEISSGDILEKVFFQLNQLVGTHPEFQANSNNSIYAIGGGIIGHSPRYNVRVSTNPVNQMSISSTGLFVSKNAEGDGKVKVDASDTKDYLENQFSGESDGIITITPQKEGGKIKFMPQINTGVLLNVIKNSYITEFCEIVDDCMAGSE